MYDYVLSVELRVMFLFVGIRESLNKRGQGVPPERVMWNNTLVIMCSVSHIEEGLFSVGIM